jgi:hypothetical protein
LAVRRVFVARIKRETKNFTNPAAAGNSIYSGSKKTYVETFLKLPGVSLSAGVEASK